MPPTPTADVQSRLRAEVAPLLAERGRAGFVLVIGAVLAFAVADAISKAHVLEPLLAIAAFQIAIAALGLVALRGVPTWGRAVAVPIVVLALVFVSGAVSDALSDNPYATSTMSLLACLVTSAFLPWGVWPQVALAAAVVVSGIGALAAVRGSLLDVGHLVVGFATTGAASVFIAHAFERGRQDRFKANEALAASTAHAEEEAHVASLLVQVGETLGARLGQPDMLEAVNALARRSLGCDWSSTFLWDDQRKAARFAANVGSPPELVATLRDVEFPLGSVPIVGAVRPGTLLEVSGNTGRALVPQELMERMGAASALYAPVTVGGKVLATQIHGYSTRTGPFTPRQRRLALGIAHATAIALENARLIADLQAASRLKSEFVATMSHELRTPLNVITGYADMLREGAGGPLATAQEDMVHRIQQSAAELFDLVTATLDLGRLEAGREPVDRASFELRRLGTELAREVAPLIAPGVTLHWDVDVAEPVVSDRAKVKTILKNLLGNALKFTREGTVAVRVTLDGDVLVLVVRDTGIGIAAESLPVIFEMFRQADGSDTRRYGGVGLGLHIVKRLTTLLNGRVDVTSTPGVGSTFTVRLPATTILRATGT